MEHDLIERTLILFKPDAVQRGIVGEILTRFERVGLKIVGTKMIFPDKSHYHKHYAAWDVSEQRNIAGRSQHIQGMRIPC